MKDPIVQVGDAVLRAKAKPVSKKDLGSRKLVSLLRRMSETLKKENFGVAIAAPQLGTSLRIFLISGKAFQVDGDVKGTKLPADKVFINPELLRVSRTKKEMTEGCLSVRHKYGSVLRHEKASIKATDEHGRPFIYHASGLIAQIFQHETDHLNGVLYIDKAVKVVDDKEWAQLRHKRAARK
jgi:peptide deformylase